MLPYCMIMNNNREKEQENTKQNEGVCFLICFFRERGCHLKQNSNCDGKGDGEWPWQKEE